MAKMSSFSFRAAATGAVLFWAGVSLPSSMVMAQTAELPASSEIEARLSATLKRFPEADTNKDGKLSMQEAMAHVAKLRAKRSESARDKDVPTKGTAPTFANVAYGSHERNVLDFWQAPNVNGAAPVVIFIHGGGFVAGDKVHYRGSGVLETLLKNGVSCAAINYRFRDTAPIQDILRDAARAVQFIRFKAEEWKVDKTRIASTGGSAGAGTSLWLNTRDDLADPKNADPVLRESSRVCAVVLHGTQATYDLSRWDGIVGEAKPEWKAFPDEDLLFYHFANRADMTSEAGRKVLKECDMLSWINEGDGPVLCITRTADLEKPITNRNEWLHHPRHAAAIEKTCAANQVECALADGGRDKEVAFFLKHLGVTPSATDSKAAAVGGQATQTPSS